MRRRSTKPRLPRRLGARCELQLRIPPASPGTDALDTSPCSLFPVSMTDEHLCRLEHRCGWLRACHFLRGKPRLNPRAQANFCPHQVCSARDGIRRLQNTKTGLVWLTFPLYCVRHDHIVLPDRSVLLPVYSGEPIRKHLPLIRVLFKEVVPHTVKNHQASCTDANVTATCFFVVSNLSDFADRLIRFKF